MTERYRIRDLFDLQMGKTPARKESRYWTDCDIDWVSIGDLSGFGKYVGNTKEKINKTAIEECHMKPVPRDTLIMSFKLSIGRTAITKKPVYTNEAIMAFLDKKLVPLDLDYLYHQFSTKDWMESSNLAVMGATLNKKTLGDKEIALPPIEEQQKVSQRLNRVKEQIRLLESMLAKTDELVQSRFVEMFGVIDDQVSLDYYVRGFISGKSLVSNQESCNQVLKTSAVASNYFDSSQLKNLPVEYIPNPDHAVHKGDVIVNRKNTIQLVGSTGYVWNDIENVYLSDLLWKAQINETTCQPIFLWQLLVNESVHSRISNMATGANSSMANITKKNLLGMLVPRVPIELQREFATFVRQVESLKTDLNQQLDRLNTLYDSLTQRYFA
ncbi:hypothetical protein COO72_04095 [Bifidobacterium callitrichos]|nr:hypothetical protein COO72_04095 [Bifidobacterium callitrichos]